MEIVNIEAGTFGRMKAALEERKATERKKGYGIRAGRMAGQSRRMPAVGHLPFQTDHLTQERSRRLQQN